jgi:hypothetical protein
MCNRTFWFESMGANWSLSSEHKLIVIKRGYTVPQARVVTTTRLRTIKVLDAAQIAMQLKRL